MKKRRKTLLIRPDNIFHVGYWSGKKFLSFGTRPTHEEAMKFWEEIIKKKGKEFK